MTVLNVVKQRRLTGYVQHKRYMHSVPQPHAGAQGSNTWPTLSCELTSQQTDYMLVEIVMVSNPTNPHPSTLTDLCLDITSHIMESNPSQVESGGWVV